MRFAATLTSLFAAVWLVSGCFSPVVDNLCRNHAECAPGLECLDGACVPIGTAGGNGGGAVGGGSGGGSGGNMGGSGGGSVCGPTNCATGCCDSTGACRSSTNATCGISGRLCQPCPGGTTCSANGLCGSTGGGGGGGGGGVGGGGGGMSCGPSSCAGCCLQGVCFDGNNTAACGRGGAMCIGCLDQNCIGGVCSGAGGGGGGGSTSCGPMTCRGCCLGGACQPGFDNSACGVGGAQCNSCASSQLCIGGVCIGNTGGGGGTCTGCFEASGACRTGNDDFACGRNGSFCASCGANQTCQNGLCVARGCGPMSCGGCCDNGACVPPFQQSAQRCGRSGDFCAACPFGATCRGGACVSSCDATSCPNGCCLNGQCIINGGEMACGTFGQLCATCFPGQV